MSTSEQLIQTPELEIRILANGIHIYKLTDWSEEGLDQWQKSFTQRLNETEENIYSIYDMRHFTTVSRQAFAIATRLEAHPKSHNACSAAILNNSRVAILVNALIRMRRNQNRNHILKTEEEAISWLLELMHKQS